MKRKPDTDVPDTSESQVDKKSKTAVVVWVVADLCLNDTDVRFGGCFQLRETSCSDVNRGTNGAPDVSATEGEGFLSAWAMLRGLDKEEESSVTESDEYVSLVGKEYLRSLLLSASDNTKKLDSGTARLFDVTSVQPPSSFSVNG